MARPGTNRLPFITELASHYNSSVFEMDAYGTTLNKQGIALPSPSALSIVSLPSDNEFVPDVDNGIDNANDSDDDNVNSHKDHEAVGSAREIKQIQLLVSL